MGATEFASPYGPTGARTEWHVGGGQFESPVPYNIFLRSHPDLLRVWRESVRAETKRFWLELCEQAANEQDADKFLAMARDINAALELKIGRLKQAGPQFVRGAFELPRCILCDIQCCSAAARLMKTERPCTKNATSSECD